MDAEQLLQRAEAAERRRQAFAAVMRDAYALAMPDRDGWQSYGYGAERQVRVYDSQAVLSVARFANRLQQALFPPQQRWAQLELPPELATRPGAEELARDLEAATEILFAHLHASSFDQAINEWALDLAAGTACLLIENGRTSGRAKAPLLRFTAVPVAHVAFEEGPTGAVETVFLRQRPPARLVRRLYPDAARWPDTVERAEREQPDREVPLLAATVYDAERDDFALHVVVEDEKQVVLTRRYRVNPWVVTRWSKSPGEIYGRGPLLAALPDIRLLNKLAELHIKALNLVVTPILKVVDDGVTNPATIRLVPGAIIPVRANGGPLGPSIEPLSPPADLGISAQTMEALRSSIRQALFDEPLPPEIKTGISATEIIERIRVFQQDTGAFGRLMADAVTPIVVRCLDILEAAGAFPPERFGGLLQAVQDDAVRIRPVSPLALAQDRADMQVVMQFVAGAATLGPAGAAILRGGLAAERAGGWLARKAGVPAELIPTADELQAARQAATEAAVAETALSSPVLGRLAGGLAPAVAQAMVGSSDGQ